MVKTHLSNQVGRSAPALCLGVCCLSSPLSALFVWVFVVCPHLCLRSLSGCLLSVFTFVWVFVVCPHLCLRSMSGERHRERQREGEREGVGEIECGCMCACVCVCV